MTSLAIKHTLEAIHFIIKQNGYELTDKQMAMADEEIIPYLEDNLDIEDKEFRVIHLGLPVLSTDKRIYPLIARYFSITQGNFGLYEDLLKEDYDFSINRITTKYYALDRSFTNYFKRNEYKKLLLKYDDVIRTFNNSLRGLDSKEKDKYIKEFSYIVHKDFSTMRVGYDSKREYNTYNFLTVRNIEFFGSDYLISLDENQRDVINSIRASLNKEKAEYIKKLLDKYPDFKKPLPFDDLVVSNFTIDELASITRKDAILYEAALKYNLISRVKNILEKSPDFNCPTTFIREEIFRVLSDEEILELSSEAIDKISKIKIKEIDNVVVMPVKEINKVVMMDKAKKKVSAVTSKFRR